MLIEIYFRSWISERSEFLDFVPIVSSTLVLVLTPQAPEIDFGLFIRPFRDEAWLIVGLIFILILASLLIPYALISYFEETQGYRIALLSGWIFFVLLNAYYGGAMTMFFTSGEIIRHYVL
jgi:hypothetical protein